jgi:hypothetical protein
MHRETGVIRLGVIAAVLLAIASRPADAITLCEKRVRPRGRCRDLRTPRHADHTGRHRHREPPRPDRGPRAERSRRPGAAFASWTRAGTTCVTSSAPARNRRACSSHAAALAARAVGFRILAHRYRDRGRSLHGVLPRSDCASQPYVRNGRPLLPPASLIGRALFYATGTDSTINPLSFEEVQDPCTGTSTARGTCCQPYTSMSGQFVAPGIRLDVSAFGLAFPFTASAP